AYGRAIPHMYILPGSFNIAYIAASTAVDGRVQDCRRVAGDRAVRCVFPQRLSGSRDGASCWRQRGAGMQRLHPPRSADGSRSRRIGGANARNGTGQGVLAAGAGTHTRPELGCQTATRSAAMISINLKSRGTIALLPLSLRAVLKTRTEGRRHYRKESALSGWSANGKLCFWSQNHFTLIPRSLEFPNLSQFRTLVGSPPRKLPSTMTSKRQSSYAAAPLRWHRLSDCGRSLYARSMIGTSRSGSSLFITYSSTNHKIRSGISQYAESRMIGKLGNRCLIWQATASTSMPSCLYSSRTAATDVSSNIFIAV